MGLIQCKLSCFHTIEHQSRLQSRNKTDFLNSLSENECILEIERHAPLVVYDLYLLYKRRARRIFKRFDFVHETNTCACNYMPMISTYKRKPMSGVLFATLDYA